MELKTKYQYTHFLHPFMVKENRYTKYILKLLKNPNCKLKIFQKEKDIGIYTYFVKNLVNVICHLFQNSLILVALYGELKLTGKTILNI